MKRFVGRLLIIGFLSTPAGLLAQREQPPQAVPSKSESQRNDFFKQGKIVRLQIDLDKQQADALRRDNRKYAKCTLKDGDSTFSDVGIHLKGAAGSFRGLDDKPGLTLNMDKYVDGQRYHGMDKFHLANSVQDPSYLSELICGELFRAAGVPASRIGHAVVTINGRNRGMYYIKEGYDNSFLKAHFGNSDGNFYDGGFLRDIDQPLQLISSKNDVADRADLKNLLNATREPDKDKRFQRLERLLDLDKFISYMVLEAVMWDWDGYPFKCNNYRVYHDPKKDKITFIPSGMDQMFGDVNGPVIPDFQGVVARTLMNTPEGRKRYIARFKEIMDKVYKTDELVRRLDELEKSIQPELAKVDPGAGRDYKNQVNRLREAIKQRPKILAEQLSKLAK